MPGYAMIGGQWGDEGKGKVIDFLARNASVVARYSGGNNAGHTVINEFGEFRLHLVPAGICWPQATCVIGNGVVIDVDVIKHELDELKIRGIDVSKLQISDRAHIIMPYHVALDQFEERARQAGALGTTGRGVGPAYVDKAARIGIRVGELLNKNSLLTQLETILSHKNAIITKIYNEKPFSAEELFAQCLSWAEWIKPFVYPVEETARMALKNGVNVLIEGAQGSLLDLDHGTYPYVTSSNPTVGGVSTGLGIGLGSLAKVIGIYKAYTTRVGSGPMPTELDEETGVLIRERAGEYGATTGRPRRCGWFDSIAAHYTVEVNGFTGAILTRLDVLDGFPTVKVCVGYELDGTVTKQFPTNSTILSKCKPIYKELLGWDKATAGLTQWEDLPDLAKKYIKFLEESMDCPIDLISTGPHRDETIVVRPIMQ
jgi:adenylosuccinate synthase